MNITTVEQMKNPIFIRDVKNYSANYFRSRKISYHRMHDHIIDMYRDLRVTITDELGKPVFLDTEVFEIDSIEYWFRDFCVFIPDWARPRVRREAFGRVIALSSILRAHSPERTSNWGMCP